MNVLSKKFLISLLLLMLVAGGGYTYLWFYSAEKLEDWLLGSVEKLEQDGCMMSYDRIEVKGFPFKLEARLLNPSIQIQKPVPFRLSGTGIITATTSVWNPRQVVIQGDEKVSVVLLGDEAEELSWASVDQFKVTGALANNFFTNYAMDLKGLKVGTWQVKALALDCMHDQGETQADKVALTINNMSFSSALNQVPLESTIQQIALEANLALPPIMDGKLPTILKAWYDQDGVIDVLKLNVVWDDIRMEGSGSFSLDQQLQPLGAFTVNVHGVDPLLKMMAKQKIIHKKVVPIIKIALMTLLGTEENQQETYHSIPLSLQERELSIAAIPIIKFDPINWSEINF